jgi:hypothetical protein
VSYKRSAKLPLFVVLSLIIGACGNLPEKNAPAACEGGTSMGPNTTLEVRSDGRAITLTMRRKETTEIFSADPPAFVSTTEEYYAEADYVVMDHIFLPDNWEEVKRTGVPRTNTTREWLDYETLAICLHEEEVFVRTGIEK